jgi:hypothetical protein
MKIRIAMTSRAKPSTSINNGTATGDRPQFAVVLGLLPPYSLEDVKRVYLAKVKDAHPDRGGDRANFDRIQLAYEQANEYLAFRGDRRQWIAARMDEYVAVEALLVRLRGLGADVETTMHDWVKRSFGEFANLTETIIGLKLSSASNAAELVDTLTAERAILAGLKTLALPGCGITDAQALQLRVHTALTRLDLGRNPISGRVAVALADWLPQLEVFDIAGTSVGWWPRQKINRRLARRRAARPPAALHPSNIR